jgi:hypothetical protein
MTERNMRYPSGFDYQYRPPSYFQNVETLVVSSILGEERRKDVQKRLAAGETLDGEDWLTESKLDEATRQMIGSVHPSMMGGEYLPSFGEDEIEIVRIVLASVTQDVISIRARRSLRRICYQVVDEYNTQYTLAKKWSAKPLTFREMIDFMERTCSAGDEGGLVLPIIEMNADAMDDPQELRDFVTVSSDFYPELECYYDMAVNRCLDKYVVEEEEEDEESDLIAD